MATHADLLIEHSIPPRIPPAACSVEKAAPLIRSPKPVIMHTTDGGKTWESSCPNSLIDFPSGEWLPKVSSFSMPHIRLRIAGRLRRRRHPEDHRRRPDLEAGTAMK